MAEIVVDEMKKFPEFKDKADKVEFIVMDSDKYYGKNYDDMQDRLPSVKKWKLASVGNQKLHFAKQSTIHLNGMLKI